MSKYITIFLVDEREIVRQGLRLMLESENGMKVVGEYADAEEALSRIEKLAPDVVLMDTRISGVKATEAVRRLKEKQPDCKIIILNLYEDGTAEDIEAVADRYLLKDTKSAELTRAIKQVYQNKRSLEELGLVKEVDLIIPPAADTDQVLGFIDQVEKTLDASIQQTIGSRDLGTAITILLKPAPLADLMDKLWGMPYVDKVEDPSAKGGFSSFVNKLATPVGSTKTSPRKRLLITLNGHADPEC